MDTILEGVPEWPLPQGIFPQYTVSCVVQPQETEHLQQGRGSKIPSNVSHGGRKRGGMMPLLPGELWHGRVFLPSRGAGNNVVPGGTPDPSTSPLPPTHAVKASTHMRRAQVGKFLSPPSPCTPTHSPVISTIPPPTPSQAVKKFAMPLTL